VGGRERRGKGEEVSEEGKEGARVEGHGGRIEESLKGERQGKDRKERQEVDVK
jgi:hypothetical protein